MTEVTPCADLFYFDVQKTHLRYPLPVVYDKDDSKINFMRKYNNATD